jgi:hypothetical protein
MKSTQMAKALKDPLKFVKGLRAVPFLIPKSSPSVRGPEHSPAPISTSPGGVILAAKA